MTRLQQAMDRGKAVRQSLPRSAHASFSRPQRDPVTILEEQHRARIPELVPVRVGRMLQSPFAYYRGTAAVMAHDFADEPATGVRIVVCGDAHISNFGLFASPERRVLFDLNDFDEAAVAPWEWDVKRLAASIVVGGRDRGLGEQSCREAAASAVRAYRDSLRALYRTTVLERYFSHVDTDWLEDVTATSSKPLLRKTVEKAKRRTSDRVMERLVVTGLDGAARFEDRPPLLTHVDYADVASVQPLFERYLSRLRPDVALLLRQFELVDVVRRVVGVGSVGTRCYLVMLMGPAGAPLFLQIKEAPPSVLETYGRQPFETPGGSARAKVHQGERVVTGQRILQSQSDPFLGWVETRRREADGMVATEFYVRQFHDMKGSVDLGQLSDDEFARYGNLCAQLLARAHSQSPSGGSICGYLGRSEVFDQAVASWAMAYADQAERDFQALVRAVRAGRLPAELGV
ncbi:MAG: DUF2252 domain-containing protein [Actinomycetes bacterium]